MCWLILNNSPLIVARLKLELSAQFSLKPASNTVSFTSYKLGVEEKTLAENKLLRTAIRGALLQIVYENDLETFHQKINQFIVDYAAHCELIDYLERNWFHEDVMKAWSRAYHENQFSHMLTNNYIESWRSQLKTAFLRRERNRRLDKLVFVLVEEVEFFASRS